MRQDSRSTEFDAGIAIIGMGCILPGGIETYQELWTFLCGGNNAIREVPADRWNNDVVYHPDPGTPGKTATHRGGFVSDIAAFDAKFFGISPREAATMDPQQRMLLETAWRALEDAGLPIDRLSGSKAGVYIGISHSDYHAIQKHAPLDIDVHTGTGGALSIAANRLSHRFNLRGPSLAIDTACSSSLVALDIACTALRSGECNMALVGGVNAILTPEVTISFSRASMLSPDGQCKAFDARANGYVRGEGAAMVVVKPLRRALADGDRIHAVIRATAVNQDGHTSTITVPSLDAQVEMLADVCHRAGIDPREVGYVEAHGTGTPVGDPIEAQAIGRVFGQADPENGACVVGSIKTNIGHLEPAAGVAGLIKTTLCVKHGMIPPHLNFATPNPHIDFAGLGIEICRALRAFPERGGQRLAAVNSFGFGGTNACAVVQEPPPRLAARAEGNAEHDGDRPLLLPLSAATPAGLEAAASDLAAVLARDGMSLADVVGTLALRRSHLEYRMAVMASRRDDAITALKSFADKTANERVVSGRRRGEPRIAFVFTGQGAQWWGMGRGLLAKDRVFRRTIEECDACFRMLSGVSILSELTADQSASRLDMTTFAQPVTFALQLGLAACWKQWGIEPEAVVGHSIGEMAAACVSGALSLEDAARVVHHRSRLQEQTRLQGAMAAIGLSAKAASVVLEDRQFNLEIAAVNAPELVTVAGARHEIERLLRDLDSRSPDVFARLLQVDYAFHSRQMDPFEDELCANLQGLTSRQPDIAMYSTVFGRTVERDELSEDYWWRNMRQPVLFKDAVEAMIADGFDTFVEISAHPALAPSLHSCLAHHGRDGTVVGSLHRQAPDFMAMTTNLAELHVRGVSIDWKAIVPRCWNFVELPGQRFEKSRHWVESEESRAARFDAPVHPLLGLRLKTAKPIWQSTLGSEAPRYLGDHQVDGTVIFPAAGYVELMLAASSEHFGTPPWELEDIVFHDALVLAPKTHVFVQTSLDPDRGTIEIRSRIRGRENPWELRASARVRAWSGPEPALEPWRPAIEPPAHFGQLRFYRQLRNEGHHFGPAFQGVNTIWREHGQALALVDLPAAAGSQSGYLLHPAQLDSCFQIVRGFRDLKDLDADEATLAFPVSIARLRFCRRPPAAVLARAIATADVPSEIAADITIIDDAGRVAATLSGFRCQRVSRAKAAHGAGGAAYYQERWHATARIDAPPDHNTAERTSRACWLILSDRRGIAARLAEFLRKRGDACILALPATQMRRLDDETFECPPEPAAVKELVKSIGDRVTCLVHMWGLDRAEEAITGASLQTAQRAGLETLLALAAAAAEAASPPKLVIVTAGSVALAADDAMSVAAIERAAMTGAMRTIANEIPEMSPRTIDLDPAAPWSDAFADEVLDGRESEVALRGDLRYACRLERISDEAIPLRREAWDRSSRRPMCRLLTTVPGSIDNLVVRSMPTPVLGDDEVLIEVHAAGLNFRDVMAVTGLLPADAEDTPAWQHLGLECAGFVRRAGKDVAPALVGARVVAIARDSFASHVCAKAELVFPIPDALSFAEAAALPTAYSTAHYSLVTLGRIRAGERVLIHAAAGGVGLAAISIARRYGARIIATAGSDEKRSFLRTLGITDVFDSRSLSFADDVLTATDGYGVDLVLNSLPGAFLEKGLSLLAPGGRFLEIGKRDVYQNNLIGLRNLRRNGAFFAIDLAQLAQQQPALLRRELERIIADLAAGRLDKLPSVEFPMAQAVDAFHYMARARHIGKVIVTFGNEPLLVEIASHAARVIRPDAAYLVTGGLGGFGLATARWLVTQGARHLTLVGRAGRPAGREAETIIAQMRAAGAEVTVCAADIASLENVRRVIDTIQTSGRPLRGIFHAAGVIDDALITKLGSDQIRRVVEPKVLGAWHLHETTRDQPLDVFVCYSSIAAHLGSVGQAHYAGANAALEAFAAMRRRLGLPGLTVAWGAISDVGYLARSPEVARHLSRTGVAGIAVRDALGRLGGLIASGCDTIAIADIDWSALARSSPALAANPRTAGLAAAHPDDAGHATQLRSRIAGLPQAERLSVTTRFMREQIASVLKVPADSVGIERPLGELGLDSLMSFELKTRIETELGIRLTIGAFLQKPTVVNLAAAILEKVDSFAPETEGGPDTPPAVEPTLSVGQEALWYIEQLALANSAYGLAMCISVYPHLDHGVAEEAYHYVVARHDCLRWVFPADANGPQAVAAPLEDFGINFHDAEAWDEATLRGELDREANAPFDLSTGPLIRAHLYRRTDCEILLLHVHQIIADAPSVGLIVQQILEAYLSLRADLPIRWSRAAPPYAAFALAQQRMLSGPAGERHLAFWRRELAGAPAAIPLPTDFPRPPTQRGAGDSRDIVIPPEIGQRLADIAREQGTTVFAILFCAFNILMHALSGASEFVIGVPVTGRTRGEFDDCIGLFVNILPIRTRTEKHRALRELLAALETTLRGAIEHQEYPFARIVGALNLPRDPARAPLVQVMFTMDKAVVVDSHGLEVTLPPLTPAAASTWGIREFRIEAMPLRRDRAQFDLAWTLEEFDGRIYGVVDYRTDLWDGSTIDGFIAQYQTIVQEIASSLDGVVQDRFSALASPPALPPPHPAVPVDTAGSRLNGRRSGAIPSPHVKNGIAVEPPAQSAHREPPNRTEAIVLAIAKEVLDRAEIGRNDDFFAAGGTSLLAMRYLSRLREAFDIALKPNQLIGAPTIAATATLIDRSRPRGSADAEPEQDAVRARSAWRPLPLAHAEGLVGTPDAAAIVFLPDSPFKATSPRTADGRTLADNSAPYWAGTCTVLPGTVSVIIVPPNRGGGDDDNQKLSDALVYASRLGARSVSVTGFVRQSTWDLANGLVPPPHGAVTSGDAMAAASLALNVESAISAARLELDDVGACFVGLGTVGAAALDMMLRRLGHPRRLVLCDLPERREHVLQLARDARERLGFAGQIEWAELAGTMPEAAYQAALFMMTTHLADVLDVDRLRPGSTIINGALQLAFDQQAAMRRAAHSGDVLFVDGRAVRLPGPVDWKWALPPGTSSELRNRLSRMVTPASGCVLGSILSGLLTGGFGSAPGGDWSIASQCDDCWEALSRAGAIAPLIQCGSWSATPVDLQNFATHAAGLRIRERGTSRPISSQ